MKMLLLLEEVEVAPVVEVENGAYLLVAGPIRVDISEEFIEFMAAIREEF